MVNTVSFCQEWHTDFDAAKNKAAAEKKNILLLFTGSDWCERCTELERKVWQSPEFKAEAEKSWILLRAEFPEKKGIPDPVDVNNMNMILTERYNRNGFFPYIVILNKYGRVIGRTGYEEFDTAKEYLTLFKNIK
ncbi:thioredoxin family protein [Flavobacterium sp. LaA7.5]|nr:thioredoxin family protein [Flavobacterium salilacus subsp. altitudinum]